MSPRVVAWLVRRSLREHLLSTTVTVLSSALACGLVMSVFSVSEQSRAAFTGGAGGFDAVLGARGSELQLVLNSVFHLETSPGNVPWSAYEDLAHDPRVETAVPYAVGDSYRGYRVVGTTPEAFESLGATVAAPGRLFDPGLREAVVGANAAFALGLRYGDTFHPEHGVATAGEHAGEEHAEEYVVVGVLEPTHSPADRVLWIPIDGVFHMDGHVLRGAGEEFHAEDDEAIPDEHKEVSAVLLRFGSPRVGFQLSTEINRPDGSLTLAWPIAASMAQLFDKLGWVTRVLEMVAYLVLVVAAGSILASLYNTMNERRGEIAVLRALGARRGLVFSAILAEAGAIATLGALGGFGVHAIIFRAAGTLVRRETGVVLDVGARHPAWIFAPLGLIALGLLAGLLPAWRAYRTEVASGLEHGV